MTVRVFCISRSIGVSMGGGGGGGAQGAQAPP